MSTDLTRFGRTFTAAAAALILAGCGSASTPTAAVSEESAAEAMEAGAAADGAILVEGTVMDASGRGLPNAHLICVGNVSCTGIGFDVIAEHRPERTQNADANGRYAMKVTGSGRFLVNAHVRGFESAFQIVNFPGGTCATGRDGCTFTVDFRLAPLAD